MAWSTCPYCQTRLNGWGNMEYHKRGKHPAEYQTTEAQQQVAWAEARLTRHAQDKAEYEILNNVLTSYDLPDLARDILTTERDKRRVTRFAGYERGTVTIPFDEQIAEDTDWLAQKRAELAALQPAEVTL